MTEPQANLSTDRPTAAELLSIIAETLSETVLHATAGHAQHQVRVAANLCRILAREAAEPAGITAGPLPPELAASLVDCDDTVAQAALPLVKELVRSKLEINKPGYDDHDSDSEDSVVA